MRGQARYIKAAHLNRFPRLPARIIRELARANVKDTNILVVGSHALYAYEAEAGVQIESGLLATLDLDILWDTRSTLKISANLAKKGLMKILRKADSSFEPLRKGSFRASNSEGFMVDLIKPEPRPPWKQDATTMGNADDLWATPLRNLDWLRDAPKFRTIVMDQDGFPLHISVPDPRAFSLHKIWVSCQPDRNPQKAPRDLDQAKAVAQMTSKFLPQFPMEGELLRHIPWIHAKTLPQIPEGF